jgi:hypothetical protein
MPDLFVAGMAAKADAVSIPDRALRKADDLGDVTATLNVKAAVAVTILTLNPLLFMEGVLEILGGIRMAARTGVAPNSACAWNVDVDTVAICRSRSIAGRQMQDKKEQEEKRNPDG